MPWSVDVVKDDVTGEAPCANGLDSSAAVPNLGVEHAPIPRLSQVTGVYLEVLGDVVESSSVSLDDHFFDDLGVDSMVMAKFCARVRKRSGVPAASMKDVYRFPTVRSLAAALTAPDIGSTMSPKLRGGGKDSTPPVPDSGNSLKSIYDPDSPLTGASEQESVALGSMIDGRVSAAGEAIFLDRRDRALRSTGRRMQAVCGAAQLMFFVAYTCVLACVVSYDFEWIDSGGGPLGRVADVLFAGGELASEYTWVAAATGALGVYVRAVIAVTGSFVVVCSLPIAVKWALVGRWKATEFPVWGWSYIRFWVVKTVVRMNPVVLFAGSPLFNLYLRALGAKIGRGALVLTPTVPVCTDLLCIGAGSVVRKDVLLSCYRAHAGMIQTGPVSIGANVFVSESTVLDIDTSMGDGAQLGHASSLHRGQSIPDGQSWHGTPGQRCDTDFRAAHGGACIDPGSALFRWYVFMRRAVFSLGQLVSVLGVRLPIASGGLLMLVSVVPWLAAAARFEGAVFTSWGAVGRIAVVTAVAFACSVFGALSLVAVCSRVLRLVVSPGRVYRLYGARYWAHRTITRLTNRKSMTRLFGDSSYIVGYLRFLGYDLSSAEQTGSNFGTEVRHETPFMASVGAGTMVADGLSLMNTDYTATTFRVSPTVIGAHNFLGNRIAYPAGGRTGRNCLLATKVMVPVDGPVRENVGLLGSPAFEIPRTVERDHRFDIADPDALGARLRAKNRHNLTTMALHLLASWGHWFGLAVISLATAALYSRLGVFGVATGMLTSFVFRVGYFVCVDRCVRGLQALRPQGCSIYDRAFWRHERFWKLADSDYIQLFNGTPFKNMLWRLLGVRIGRGVFDDGTFLPERRFANIGDYSTLNAGSVIQCHSQEDGAFKSDHTTVGAYATLGVGSFVHYGVAIGEHVTVDTDAFVMKGEQLDADSHWTGNPARPVDRPGQAPAAVDERYVDVLLARIRALESQIEQMAPAARGSHPGTVALAAALALLAIAGGATATTHTRLATAFPLAWRTLVAGLAPSERPLLPVVPAAPVGTGTDNTGGVEPAPTALSRGRTQVVGRVPVVPRHVPMIQPQQVAVKSAPGASVPAATSRARAEAAVKQAEAQLKALKAEQKKSKSSAGSKGTGK